MLPAGRGSRCWPGSQMRASTALREHLIRRMEESALKPAHPWIAALFIAGTGAADLAAWDHHRCVGAALAPVHFEHAQAGCVTLYVKTNQI